ncbi:MAG: hypothetical protein M1816_002009 [Peltula sp. TS41687]|nr:MAG: hypothetical protein M1816_002009 [Peltula sp. TS41687]
MAPPSPSQTRQSIPRDRFGSTFSAYKLQTYHDPSSRGPSSHSIRTLAWSATGQHIATGSADRALRIWDPTKPTPKSSTSLTGHTGAIERVAWNPTRDNELASASSDGTVRFWDVRTRRSTAEIKLGGEGFTLAWHPGGRMLLAGRKDDVLVAIDSKTTKPTPLTLLPQSVQTNQTIFSHSGAEVILTTGAGTVKFMAYPEWSVLHALNAHTSACLSLDLCPRGKFLAVGGSDALVSVWDTTDWVCRYTLSEMMGPVRSVGFSFDGCYLCAGSDEGLGVEVAHVDSGETVHVLQTAHPAPFVAWHPHRYWLAYSGDPGGLKIVGPQGLG